ncbi:MAG: hypothetical protein U0841_19005 [Chloroflexia bacterium]
MQQGADAALSPGGWPHAARSSGGSCRGLIGGGKPQRSSWSSASALVPRRSRGGKDPTPTVNATATASVVAAANLSATQTAGRGEAVGVGIRVGRCEQRAAERRRLLPPVERPAECPGQRPAERARERLPLPSGRARPRLAARTSVRPGVRATHSPPSGAEAGAGLRPSCWHRTCRVETYNGNASTP